MTYNFKEIDHTLFYTVSTNTMDINIPTNIYTAPKAIRKNSHIDLINWKVPKPHINYLYEFIKRAAVIYNKYKSEMEVFILWDTINKTHVFFIPQQEVSGGNVSFEWDIPENHILLFELHSHHTMSITFSATDDRSDGSLDILPHISAVLKNIDKINMLDLNKNIDIRLSYLGNKTSLEISDIFVEDVYNMPQITKSAPVVTDFTNMYNINTPTYGGYGGYSNYNYKGQNTIHREASEKPAITPKANVIKAKTEILDDKDDIFTFVKNRMSDVNSEVKK